MTELHAGDVLSPHDLTTITGSPAPVPDAGKVVHLQFRRYAGCPVCNLHLRSFAARHGELVAAGIREVVVFHSCAETMREFQGQLPFAAIADPEKRLYAEFGVETMSVWLALDPRSWLAAARAITRAPSLRGATGPGEQHLGLPADFLIGREGQVLAAKYGQRVDDHWSVDDVLGLAAA
jgi:peroxiredoxin